MRVSSKYGPMSKSFCKFGLANGSVDDDAADDTDAVNGNAIDGGELIINLDATISIRFSATGKRRIGRSLETATTGAADAVVVVVVVVATAATADDDDVDVEFGNRIIAGMVINVVNEIVEVVETFGAVAITVVPVVFFIVAVGVTAAAAVVVVVVVDGNVKLWVLFVCSCVVGDVTTNVACTLCSISGLVMASTIKKNEKRKRKAESNKCENIYKRENYV